MTLSPVLLAILCLLAVGVLDLVFKAYATQPRSRGMLIFGIGCIWTALHLVSLLLSGQFLNFDKVSLGYGAIAAGFLVASNLLLVECMTRLPVSIGSTIYRLNTIPLVVLAFFFLGEAPGLLKIAGIGAGIVTIVLLHQSNSMDDSNIKGQTVFLYLIITAACIRALYGMFTKLGVNQGGDPNTMMLCASLGWCIGGIAYAGIREKRIILTPDKMKFIFMGGFLVFSIVWLLTTALTLGEASVIIPLTNMGFVAAFVLSVVFGYERLSPKKTMAIISAMVSIFLLTQVA